MSTASIKFDSATLQTYIFLMVAELSKRSGPYRNINEDFLLLMINAKARYVRFHICFFIKFIFRHCERERSNPDLAA
jgi:hypothetical protein